MESAFDRVTTALTNWGSVQRGPNWNCPAHEDGKASLTVTKDADKVLLNCKASCSTESILRIIGLGMRDLFDSPKEQRERRLIARYLYKDLDGTILFSKERYEPKDFLIARPGVNGEWIMKLGDTKKVLYNLPELQAAIARDETVYIVEGEKDADALMTRGVVATCNYEGAGKWMPGYSEWFTGARVVIVADRDEAGYLHAKDIRASLMQVAHNVTIVQSAVEKPKADISDHFAAGYGLEHLRPLGGTFKPVHLGRLLEPGAIKPPELLADGMLYKGGLHCIAGAPDSGKTTLACYWAAQLLSEGKRVAFFDEEGGQEIVAEKLYSLGAKKSHMDDLIYVPFPGRMWDDSDVEALGEFLRENRPELVLWDSSAAFLARAGLDENSAPAVTNWWARVLTPVARELQAAVLVIDHDTKASELSRYARGSGAKLAALDVQYKVEMRTPFTRNKDGELRLFITKDRRGYLERDWVVDVRVGTGISPQFRRDTDAEMEAEQKVFDSWGKSKRKVYGALTDDWLSVVQIRANINKFFPEDKPLSETSIGQYLNELHRKDRKVVRRGNETRAEWKKN